jgi:prophage regulatory protein
MQDNTDTFMPLPAVKAVTGLSRSTIYECIGRGVFPAPVKIGRASRWSLAEINAWMESRRAERKQAA